MLKLRNLLSLSLLFLFVAGAVADETVVAISIDDIHADASTLEGQRYVSTGQPSAETLSLVREAGFVAVLDMRTESEDRGFDEAAAVEALGMEYIQLPVAGAEGTTFENAAALDDINVAIGLAPDYEDLWILRFRLLEREPGLARDILHPGLVDRAVEDADAGRVAGERPVGERLDRKRGARDGDAVGVHVRRDQVRLVPDRGKRKLEVHVTGQNRSAGRRPGPGDGPVVRTPAHPDGSGKRREIGGQP